MVCINSTVAHLNDKTNKVTTLMSQAVQQSTPAQQTRPAPEQQYVPPATSAAPQQVIKKPEPQKPKVFQFAFNNEVPTLDPSLLDQVTTLPYGSVLGMDDSRRSYFTFGPYPVKVPEQSLVSTRPVCGVIPQGGVARVIVSEPPRYMFNTHPSAIVSFVPGKPMRALSQYDSSEAYWETYMSWSALASDWDNHMDRYKINVNGKEHPEKPVMVIGVIAGDHPDHKVAVFCFGK